jgi:hypothetical protein
MLAVLGHRSAGGNRLKKPGDTSMRWKEATAEGAMLTNLFVHALETTYMLARIASDDQVRQCLFTLLHGYGGTDDDPGSRVNAAVEQLGDLYGGNRGIVQHLAGMDRRVLEEAFDVWVQPVSAFHVHKLVDVWGTLCKQEKKEPLPRYITLMLSQRDMDEDEMETELPDVDIMKRAFRHVRCASSEVRAGALRRLFATAETPGQPWSEDAYLRHEDPPHDEGGDGSSGGSSPRREPLDEPDSLDGGGESADRGGTGSSADGGGAGNAGGRGNPP